MEQKIDRILDIVTILQGDVTILKQDVSNLKQNVTVLKQHVSNLEEDMSNLNDRVSIIEIEHGKKLQVLLERDIDYIRKQTDCSSEFNRIDNTLNKHDARIYNLEHPA